VYDLPSGAMTSAVFQTLLTADEIFITVTPNVIGVRNATKLFAKLEDLRPNDPPPHLIINQKGVPDRSEIDLKTVAATIGRQPNFIINYDGELFERSLAEGADLETVDAGAQPVAVIKQCAAFITGKNTVQKANSGLKRVLGNLFRS
jgi:pilus assembly protein CpaE